MKNREEASQDQLWNLVVVAVYAAVVGATLPFHEPWGDEAQSWLICRDLSYPDIVRQMAYEGTPALWHLLQAPLAKAGLPYASLGILNMVIAVAAVAVLCLASPFSLWQKCAVAFSYLMFYEYSIIARCYALIVLLLFVVAALYPSRHNRPLAFALAVGALANVNVQSLSIALLVTGLYLVEGFRLRFGLRAKLAAVGMLMSIVAAIVQLLPPKDLLNDGLFPSFFPEMSLLMPYRALLAATPLPDYVGLPLAIAALVTVTWNLRGNLVSLGVVVCVYLGWCYLFIFKLWYLAQVRHCGLFAMVLVFVLWMARDDERLPRSWPRFRFSRQRLGSWRMCKAEMIVFATLGSSAMEGWQFCRQERTELYSGARGAAAFLEVNHPDAPIAVHASWHAAAMLPYLPEQAFFSLEVEKPVTFTTFTARLRDNVQLEETELIRRANRSLPHARPWLVLNHPLRAASRWGYELAFATPARTIIPDEVFYIYRPKGQI